MLEDFGFTPTEARAYRALLSLGPSTGYAVARELGVARANVYQALEGLARRGAAQKAATDPVLYSAAGPAALSAALERSFRRSLTNLEDELNSLPIAGTRGGAELELLTTADQLVARACACADSAAIELLAVTGPWAEALNERLVAAQDRRVQLRSRSLGEAGPADSGSRPVTEDELRAYWGGLPVAVVADRKRAVFGVLAGGQSASGVSTSAPGAVPFLRHLLRREVTL